MTGNLKALGLALLAIAALGAVAAQGAAAHEFKSEAASTVLTGANETGTKDVLTFTKGGVVKGRIVCDTTSITGTQAGKSVTSITVHAIWTGCKFVLPSGEELAAEFKTGGCNFELFGVTTTSADLTGEHASVSIDCETTAGKHLHQYEVIAAGCTLDIGMTDITGTSLVNQKLHGVRYANVKDPTLHAVTVTSTLRTIHFTTKGAPCALLGIKEGIEYTEGDYDAQTLVTGYEDQGVTGGSTTNGFVYKEGPQVAITVE